MTIFGWDASHYDGELDEATLALARSEGIEFFTHKIGEGISNTDLTAPGALNAARAAGIKVIGAYYFIHSGDMEYQALRCVSLADNMVPWWRDFPGWFWQTDAETDTGGHLPSPAEVKAFSDELALQSKRRVIVYASHGMYGDTLRGLGHSLWNANYPTNKRAPFRDLYPGDHYAGWNDYSGQTPEIAQYTSSATIAGKTTCDANAFRGTINQLLTLIGGDTVTYPTPAEIARGVWNTAGSTNTQDPNNPTKKLSAGTVVDIIYENTGTADTKLDELAVKVDKVLTLLTGLTGEAIPVTGTVSLQATTPPVTG